MKAESDHIQQHSINREEFARILQRIDENLAIRVPPANQHSSLQDLPTLPNFTDIRNALHEIRQSRAPLFVVEGAQHIRLLKRTLNLVIRIFGHKQIQFNQGVLGTFDLLIGAMVSLRQQAIHQRYMNALIEQQQAEIRELQAEVEQLRQHMSLPTADKKP